MLSGVPERSSGATAGGATDGKKRVRQAGDEYALCDSSYKSRKTAAIVVVQHGFINTCLD